MHGANLCEDNVRQGLSFGFEIVVDLLIPSNQVLELRYNL